MAVSPAGVVRPRAAPSASAAPSAALAWMGTTARLTVTGGPAHLAARGRSRLAHLARLWDASHPGSDLHRVAAHPGVVVDVRPETATLVALALRYRTSSGGRFEPLPPTGTGAATPDAADVVVDVRRGRVGVPIGRRFAPGAFARTVAVALVTAELREEGAADVHVRFDDDARAGHVRTDDDLGAVAA